MSVLVDTSVWIRFLANRAPYAAALADLLADYDRMDRAPLVSHAEVVAFVRERKLNGRGIGWVDAHLLASALVGQVKLWTADSPLAAMATELGIAYE